VAAYAADGTDVLGGDIHTSIQDEKVLTQADKHYYDGMWAGIHGGNNMVYYQKVRSYDPASHTLRIDYFSGNIYPQTRYSLYNSVRLIDVPGEYSVEETDDPAVCKVFLMPEKADDAGPVGPIVEKKAGEELVWLVVGEHRPAGNYEAPPESLTRRAPEICNTLGAYNYRSTQVAVLFLAAGTILGALWADVSWGRFWGWDPKEVWALVSLLIYLAVLHGRYAGWFGNFGLAVGSVIGAPSILMAWYGVNYWIRSGKHSYGEGTGGLGWVSSAVVVNWAYVLAAAVRYYAEIRRHVA